MSPTLTLGKTKRPSISDIVPIVVFFTKIEAPIIGLLFSSFIIPLQVILNLFNAFWANS